MSRVLTAEEVSKLRPAGGWAGVKFRVTEAAMMEKADGTGMVCRFQPPGHWDATAGTVFSLTEKQLEGLHPERWLESGTVEIVQPRPTRLDPKPEVVTDGG